MHTKQSPRSRSFHLPTNTPKAMSYRVLRTHTESYYHCIDRVVDRTRCLHNAERRHFRLWMRRLAQFCGVQVVTYCLMENHFHLLVRVPCRETMLSIEPLTEPRLRQLLPLIYGGRDLRDAVQELDRAVQQDSTGKWLAEILARYEARRFSLSIFLKELKQRYTRWHNRRHRRTGTLWEDRFRSVLVEGDERTLLTIAAYIDLNPVRAGLVNDPKDYLWSGYAEAVAGEKAAREGLAAVLENTSYGVNRRVTWRRTAPRYRMLLFGHGEKRDADAKTGTAGRPGMTSREVAEVLEAGGELSVCEVLRCRVRYFTHGVAIGGEEFLQQVMEENRQHFSANRTTAGHRMKGSDWGGMQVLRGLQHDLFGNGAGKRE